MVGAVFILFTRGLNVGSSPSSNDFVASYMRSIDFCEMLLANISFLRFDTIFKRSINFSIFNDDMDQFSTPFFVYFLFGNGTVKRTNPIAQFSSGIMTKISKTKGTTVSACLQQSFQTFFINELKQ